MERAVEQRRTEADAAKKEHEAASKRLATLKESVATKRRNHDGATTDAAKTRTASQLKETRQKHKDQKKTTAALLKADESARIMLEGAERALERAKKTVAAARARVPTKKPTSKKPTSKKPTSKAPAKKPTAKKPTSKKQKQKQQLKAKAKRH